MAQARGASGDKRKWIIGIAAVVVVAALVIGGVIWTISDKNKTEGQVISPGASTSALAGDVTQKRDGVAVTVGKPGAAASIDVYADFLCPICGEFEKQYKGQIEQAVNDGKLQVRYHMVPLLNTKSDPPGYSLDSANAALAAADAGKFVQFHDALFANQPEEGKRGYDKAQLIKLGKDVGITDPKFAADGQRRHLRAAAEHRVPADRERPEAGAGLRWRAERLRHADGHFERHDRVLAGPGLAQEGHRLSPGNSPTRVRTVV